MPTSGNGLRFYWNEHGTDTWHGEQVAAGGTTFSAPSVAQVGGYVVIAARGAGGSLDVYWAASVGSGWNQEQVAGPATTFSSPSETVNGNSENIANIGYTGNRYFWWNRGDGGYSAELVDTSANL